MLNGFCFALFRFIIRQLHEKLEASKIQEIVCGGQGNNTKILWSLVRSSIWRK